jgi:glycosyltransferase involved in cell wall biosynthesis
MPHTPRISVLLTSYNRDAFVAEAIESVLAQSLTDFELIVSDDHSSDRTVEIANAYAARDARIRVSVNERNLGDYGNRRHVASLARGRFLKYHDSDDVMYRHCLSTMFELLDAEPRAAFALSGSGSWPGGPCPMLLTPRLAYARECLGLGLFHQGPASALFRTDAFRALGGFPEICFTTAFIRGRRSPSRTASRPTRALPARCGGC